MTTRPAPRESRSVRLRQDEWDLAEAISRLNGEIGAGFGLRAALVREENRLRRSADRDRFSAILRDIESERDR